MIGCIPSDCRIDQTPTVDEAMRRVNFRQAVRFSTYRVRCAQLPARAMGTVMEGVGVLLAVAVAIVRGAMSPGPALCMTEDNMSASD